MVDTNMSQKLFGVCFYATVVELWWDECKTEDSNLIFGRFSDITDPTLTILAWYIVFVRAQYNLFVVSQNNYSS
jgi:hypothetical protein